MIKILSAGVFFVLLALTINTAYASVWWGSYATVQCHTLLNPTHTFSHLSFYCINRFQRHNPEAWISGNFSSNVSCNAESMAPGYFSPFDKIDNISAAHAYECKHKIRYKNYEDGRYYAYPVECISTITTVNGKLKQVRVETNLPSLCRHWGALQ